MSCDRKKIPAGWEVKKLGEVCITGAGGTPLKSHPEYYKDGTIPWLLSGEVSQGEIFFARNYISKSGLANSSTKIFPKNTVLVAMYGATAGQVGILRFEAATNQAVCGIIPNERMSSEFLFYCFLSKKDELIAQAVGGAQPNISQLKIKDTLIPTPLLSEQKRIVAILDESFRAIAEAKDNAEKNLANARELFEGYLNQVFANPGEDWEDTSLSKEVDLLCGYAFQSKKYSENTSDVSLLRGDNIMQGYMRWAEAKRWPKDEIFEYSRYCLAENDIVLAMDRPWVKAGLKCARLSKDDLPALLVQRVARLRSKNIDNDFLFIIIQSQQFTKHLLSLQNGIGVPYISGDQILSYIFQIPNKAQQKKIVNNVYTLELETNRLELIYQQKISSLEELKKSILQKAFSGEL